MKPQRTKFFIIVSAIALIGLLLIQINWILKSANLKEEQFNQKVRMVLNSASNELNGNELFCTAGKCRIKGEENECTIELNFQERSIIDSLLKSYLNYYDVNLHYEFEIIESDSSLRNVVEKSNSIFKQVLENNDSQKASALKLHFPNKKDFIIAEMGTMFISSLVLIAIIITFFSITIKSLIQQKRIAERTTAFVNNMTHEFKTPMTTISLASNRLLHETIMNKPDKIRYYSEIIHDENEKLKLQVEKILDIAAFENKDFVIDNTPVDLHEVLTNAIKSMHLQVQNKNGQIRSTLQASNCMISGDKIHLTNSIINILDNANKYSNKPPEITITTQNKNKTIVLTICDRGIGIGKEKLQYIFDSFYRVPTGDSHNVKGFGLGLTYVKKIVETFGGNILVKSELNKGTCFELAFPLLNS